jgi:hypothetical protein
MNGIGTAVDSVNGAAIVKRAAEQGLPMGQYNYAVYLENGKGVPENRALAMEGEICMQRRHTNDAIKYLITRPVSSCGRLETNSEVIVALAPSLRGTVLFAIASPVWDEPSGCEGDRITGTILSTER